MSELSSCQPVLHGIALLSVSQLLVLLLDDVAGIPMRVAAEHPSRCKFPQAAGSLQRCQ